jgi:hypothetical protein
MREQNKDPKAVSASAIIPAHYLDIEISLGFKALDNLEYPID